MDPSLAESMDVNTENILILCPISAQNLPSFINSLTRTATVDVIMVDSVAALGIQCEHMIGVIFHDLQCWIIMQARRIHSANLKLFIVFLNMVRSNPKQGKVSDIWMRPPMDEMP